MRLLQTLLVVGMPFVAGVLCHWTIVYVYRPAAAQRRLRAQREAEGRQQVARRQMKPTDLLSGVSAARPIVWARPGTPRRVQDVWSPPK